MRTSVKVKHNIPDLVVSSYANTGQNPWQDVTLLGAALPGISESGGNIYPRAGALTQSHDYKGNKVYNSL